MERSTTNTSIVLNVGGNGENLHVINNIQSQLCDKCYRFELKKRIHELEIELDETMTHLEFHSRIVKQLVKNGYG